MPHEPRPDSRLPRWATPAVMVLITTLSLTVVLQGLSQFGAKERLDEMSIQTLDALRALRPLALGHRYLDTLTDVMTPCRHVSFSELHQCYQDHPTGQQSFPQVAWQLLQALYLLVRGIFGESWTAAIVDVLQLLAGFSLATYLGARIHLFRAEYSYPLMLIYIPFGILCTCLLSLPILGVMYLASFLFGEVMPAPIHVSLYCGCWIVSLTCTSRIFEAFLHHRFGAVIERLISRR